jgi:hypothetical protein
MSKDDLASIKLTCFRSDVYEPSDVGDVHDSLLRDPVLGGDIPNASDHIQASLP